MANEGPTTVGSINAYLELDIDRFLAKVEEAKAAAATIDGKTYRASVDVKSDSARTAAKDVESVGTATENAAKRTKAAANSIEGDTKRVAKAAEDAKNAQVNWAGAAIGALVGISAAAPPVAAGAVAITGAFGIMGAAGVLALTGIVREMKSGGDAANAYKGVIGSLQSDLYGLQDAAAKGLLPGVQASVALLKGDMPGLNAEVQHFAGMLGGILPTGLDAVVTLLERAQPLFDAGGKYLASFVQGLDGFAHGNGYTQFIQYTLQNMPQVVAFLNSVVHLAGDFLAAWAPLGSETLPLLTGLVTGVDDIVRATGPLVPAVVAFAGAWQVINPVVGVLKGIGGQLDSVAAKAGMATSELTAMAGPLALVIAAAGAVNAINNMVAPTNSTSDIMAMQPKAIAAQFGNNGAFGSSAMSNLKAQGQIGQAINAGPIGTVMSYTFGGLFNSTNRANAVNAQNTDQAVSGMLTNGNAQQGVAAAKALQAAWRQANGSLDGFSATFPQITAGLAQVDARQKAAAASASAFAHSVEGEAQANMAAAKSIQTLDGSYMSAKDAIDAVTKARTADGTSLSMDTEKGRANREAILAAAQAISAYGDGLVKSGKSSAAAESAMAPLVGQLADQAVKAGMSKSAVIALVAEYMHLPKSVVTELLAEDKASAKANAAANAAHRFSIGKYISTLEGNGVPADRAVAMALAAARKWASTHATATLDANTRAALAAAAAARDQINSMRATIFVSAVASGVSNGRASQIAKNAVQFGATGGTAGMDSFGTMNALRGYAGGGTISGPGSAAADMAGLYRLANGEEVISNLFGQADRWRPLLKAINAGRVDYRTFEQIAGRMQQNRAPQRVTTIAPEVHVHNPVAQDPVSQVTEAAQLALAFNGLG